MKKHVQTGDEKKLLLRELKLMFSVLRPFAEIPPETWQGYAMGLSELTGPQILSIVPLILERRWEFPPQPAEIRDMVREADSGNLLTKEAREDCPKCQGTGFEIVTVDGARCATPCECRNRVEVV
jgi:hypothetical protein